jgi:hypothetical protein
MKVSLVRALIGRFEWRNVDGGNVERLFELFLRLDKRFAFRLRGPRGEDGERLLRVSKWTRSREDVELRIGNRFGREGDGL